MALATILMVEDDSEIGLVYAELLSLSGYDVTLVTTAAVALNKLTTGTHVDILFSDVRLGDGPNGVWLAEQARRLQPDLVVVLATAYTSAFREVEGKPYPLILKPYKNSRHLVELFDCLLRERDQKE